MENYKSTHTNTETFGKKEIETLIPNEIVFKIQDSLNELNDKWLKTPIIINPDNLSVIMGLVESDIDSARLKYKVTIELIQ